jgi:hypothetical protein
MSIPDALAAFAEPATTTVTIFEIKTDAILDSEVWGLRHPSGLSIHLATSIVEQSHFCKLPFIQVRNS